MGWSIKPAETQIYVDGGCRNNQKESNVGAWAFIVYVGSERKGSRSKGEFNTTNNVQELKAMLEALKWAVKYAKPVQICSDSQYVVDTVTKWAKGWQAKGWKKADGSVPKNLTIIQDIMSLYDPSLHTIVKVKGHSGESRNEEVDLLVNVVMDELVMNSEHCPLNFND